MKVGKKRVATALRELGLTPNKLGLEKNEKRLYEYLQAVGRVANTAAACKALGMSARTLTDTLRTLTEKLEASSPAPQQPKPFIPFAESGKEGAQHEITTN